MLKVEEILNNKGSKVLLSAVVIGSTYRSTWEKYSLPSWLRYCYRQGFSLAIVTEVDSSIEVKPTWYKYLVPSALDNTAISYDYLAIIDADQIISPIAPSLLESCEPKSIGIVPMIPNVEQTLTARKLISFFRNVHLDSSYPLDSTMVGLQQGDGQFGFNPFIGTTEISTGFYLVPKSMVTLFEKIFILSKKAGEFTGGGDQLLASREIFKVGHHFIDSRWQGIWPDIMATNYSNFYAGCSSSDGAFGVAASLVNYYCIHFATSWPEKDFWELDSLDAFDQIIPKERQAELVRYLSEYIDPKSYGRLSPPSKKLLS